MKNLLNYIVCSLVKNPKDVIIKESKEDDYSNLVIKVNPNDIRTLIGKNGLTIKAIREIVKIKAIVKGKKVDITVER